MKILMLLLFKCIYAKLGIKEEDKIEKSITYLYMEEFCFKEQNII
jgi:hypothetical protein